MTMGVKFSKNKKIQDSTNSQLISEEERQLKLHHQLQRQKFKEIWKKSLEKLKSLNEGSIW